MSQSLTDISMHLRSGGAVMLGSLDNQRRETVTSSNLRYVDNFGIAYYDDGTLFIVPWSTVSFIRFDAADE